MPVKGPEPCSCSHNALDSSRSWDSIATRMDPSHPFAHKDGYGGNARMEHVAVPFRVEPKGPGSLHTGPGSRSAARIMRLETPLLTQDHHHGDGNHKSWVYTDRRFPVTGVGSRRPVAPTAQTCSAERRPVTLRVDLTTPAWLTQAAPRTQGIASLHVR